MASFTTILLRALSVLAERLTPLTRADAQLAVELLTALFSQLNTTGILCQFGDDGFSSTKKELVCVPAKWNRKQWAFHRCVCENCPIFLQAMKEREALTGGKHDS